MEKLKDLLTLSEAAELLSVSRMKMSRMVKTKVVTTQNDPLDERVKLVKREDILALIVRDRAA
jgi:predicted HTH domain antitoxin